jgi:hypothetical protein
MEVYHWNKATILAEGRSTKISLNDMKIQKFGLV